MNLPEVAALRACAALATAAAGIVVAVHHPSGRAFHAGPPANRFVDRPVDMLRSAVSEAVERCSTQRIEALLGFEINGCVTSVMSAVDGIDSIGSGVWRMRSMGTVTYVIASLEPANRVMNAVNSLDADPSLEVNVSSDPFLNVTLIYVDVSDSVDDIAHIERRVVDVLSPLAFANPADPVPDRHS